MKLEYEALRADGGNLIKGEIDAGSEREAVRLLEIDGMVVTDIRSQVEKPARRFQRGVSRQEVVLALFELATLLESGVSIAEAIESQSQSEYHPKLNQFFDFVSQKLRGGESLAQAFQKSDLEVPDYLIQLVQSGELSGRLPDCLRRGVAQMEYELDISSQFRAALIYPGVLLLSGFVAVSLIFVLVVPRFTHVLERGTDLPWLATAVLTSGMFFNQYYPFLLTGLVGPRFFGRADIARVQTAETQIQMMKSAISLYYLDVGRFPSTEQGLKSLVRKPADVKFWQGPYLEDEVPLDPWQNPYLHQATKSGISDFSLFSYGADGSEGGEQLDTDVGYLPDS